MMKNVVVAFIVTISLPTTCSTQFLNASKYKILVWHTDNKRRGFVYFLELLNRHTASRKKKDVAHKRKFGATVVARSTITRNE